MLSKYISSFLLLFLLVQAGQAQIRFRETTFEEFKYPNGVSDSNFVDYLRVREEKKFPKARTMKIMSFITRDDPRTVVAYYTRLCGQRFYKTGDRLVYNFSEINNQYASRIEIYPVKIPRIMQNYWPTRIDIFMISYPITVRPELHLNRTFEDLEKMAGKLAFEGELLEDVAVLEMEELGQDSEVFIVATKKSFESVYRFFRNRYGPIRVIPAIDGEMYVRDFDLDATRTLGLYRKNMKLYIRVEENPIVIDRSGNSQVYHGYVFIKYMFWHNVDDQ